MKKKMFDFMKSVPLYHGGEHSKGKRKVARPISTKDALHIVMKSNCARGEWDLLNPRHCKKIREQIIKVAKRFKIKVYRYAIVGNHIHLLIRGKRRHDLQNFFRLITGSIAMLVTGAKKGNGICRFWTRLLFSRVVNFGRSFKIIKNYILKNEREEAFLLLINQSRPQDGPPDNNQ